MLRTITAGLFILCLATGGMLMWQWHAYSQENEKQGMESSAAVRQNIQLQVKDDAIQVKQVISQMQKGRYKILNPGKAAYTIDGGAGPEVLIDNDHGTATLEYVLPFEANGKSRLLSGWALQLEGVETESTIVEITVLSGRTGSWSAGAKMIGKTEKELIDYYMFKKDGPPFPLYYDEGSLIYTKLSTGTYLYYGGTGNPDAQWLNALFERYGSDDVYILTPNYRDAAEDGLVILNAGKGLGKQVEAKLSQRYADSRFPFLSGKEKWQQNVLLNIGENRDLGGPKTKAMASMLRERMSAEELSLFVEAAGSSAEPLTALRLDELLSAAKGQQTVFFRSNADGKTKVIPLYFFSNDTIIVNGEKIAERAVDEGYRRLLPFLPIIEKAGFSYTVIDGDEVLAKKGEDTLRFYPGQKVFILNGTDYSTGTAPLVRMSGTFYIQESWLINIFGAGITGGGETIEIAI